MKYKIYRMKFRTPLHVGNGLLSDSEDSFRADTLFSALYIEAMKVGAGEQLYRYVIEGRLLLSDAMPCNKDVFCIPKPFLYVASKNAGDSLEKKKVKNLKCLPFDALESFLNGDISKIEDSVFDMALFISFSKAAVRGLEDSLPYQVGAYSFKDDWELYVILGYEDGEVEGCVNGLFQNLGWVGIGGKRSSGMGKFNVSESKLPREFIERIEGAASYEKKMSLSISLPKDEELEKALEGSSYSLVKRSGFVYSETYAPEQRKKRDAFLFAAGSCFSNMYIGSLIDVSKSGTHPVYRYAKPIFMGVR